MNGVSQQQIAQFKRWRGLIMGYVYQGLHAQASRLDDLTLLGMLRDFGHSGVGLNHVRALLIELRDANYLRFRAEKNDWSGETEISQIEITAVGCKLLEKVVRDESVQIL